MRGRIMTSRAVNGRTSSSPSRRRRAGIAVLGAVLAVGGPTGQGSADARSGPAAGRAGQQEAAGPRGVNPYLAFLPPGTKPDWEGWNAELSRRAEQQAVARASAATNARGASAPAVPLTVREAEPRTRLGDNDLPRVSQVVDDFGTRAGQNPRAVLSGTMAPSTTATAERIPPPAEPNDGDDAFDTGIPGKRLGFTTTSTMRPSGGFDGDAYNLRLAVGQIVDVRVEVLSGKLDPDTLAIVGRTPSDSSLMGTTPIPPEVGPGGPGPESASVGLLRYRAQRPGLHQIYVADSAPGRYRLTATVGDGDRDVYAVDLRAGDVLGVSGIGVSPTYNTAISLYDDRGRLAQNMLKEFDGTAPVSANYPITSPLPGDTGPVAQHVAARDGRYFVEIRTNDKVSNTPVDYRARMEVYRSGGTGSRRTQTLYLDFDGATVDTSALFGAPDGGPRTLSLMSAFLRQWGLRPGQERALARRVTATVRENLLRDLRRSGLSDSVDVKIVNGFDQPDQFGRRGVSRVVVGGTVEEFELETIGVSQSIDPGNFAREETAVVLLDTLSDRSGPASLNKYLSPGADRLAFIGRALGNVVSHETGHSIGSWHTVNTNRTANLMDAGGRGFPRLYGLGPDGRGGTADDVDVDFGRDTYAPEGGFGEIAFAGGEEDTLARSTFGMSHRR